MRLFQFLDTPLHGLAAHTQHLNLCLDDLLYLANGADIRDGTVVGPELVCARRFETGVQVFAAGIGAGADGEHGIFAPLQRRVGDIERKRVPGYDV